jgi:acetyl/propionyl-CoA carboxylase alpha subunit
VDVDGRRLAVDAVLVGSAAWSLLVGPAEAGHHGRRSYEVGIVERPAGELWVYVNGRVVPVRFGGQRWRRRRAGPAADTGSGPQRIAAPMPGRVVKVLVRPGEAVTARQGLVVIEAMKMENELRASRPGIVRDVRVAEGASVEAHTVLMVIE